MKCLLTAGRQSCRLSFPPFPFNICVTEALDGVGQQHKIHQSTQVEAKRQVLWGARWAPEPKRCERAGKLAPARWTSVRVQQECAAWGFPSSRDALCATAMPADHCKWQQVPQHPQDTCMQRSVGRLAMCRWHLMGECAARRCK